MASKISFTVGFQAYRRDATHIIQSEQLRHHACEQQNTQFAYIYTTKIYMYLKNAAKHY
jgi:hypothetical protein